MLLEEAFQVILIPGFITRLIFLRQISRKQTILQFLHPETGQQMEFRLEKPNEEPWNIG